MTTSSSSVTFYFLFTSVGSSSNLLRLGLLPGSVNGSLRCSKVTHGRGRGSSTLNLSLGLSRGLSLSLLLLILLIGVAVEEEIDHDVPSLVTLELTLDAEDLTSEEPVHQTNRSAALVVAGDGNIDVAERAVSAAKSNDGEVAVRSLSDSLVIHARVSHDEKARLAETLLNLVGEGTRGETASDSLDAEVLSELEDSTLTIRTLRNNDDVLRVLDASDDTGSKDELLPSGLQVDDVNTISAGLENVGSHAGVQVDCTDVGLTSKKHLHVLGRDVHASGELCHLLYLCASPKEKLKTNKIK